MSKSDKELAVEIAKAYIEASGHSKLANGASKNLLSADSVLKIIEATYQTLKKLD